MCVVSVGRRLRYIINRLLSRVGILVQLFFQIREIVTERRDCQNKQADVNRILDRAFKACYNVCVVEMSRKYNSLREV